MYVVVKEFEHLKFSCSLWLMKPPHKISEVTEHQHSVLVFHVIIFLREYLISSKLVKAIILLSQKTNVKIHIEANRLINQIKLNTLGDPMLKQAPETHVVVDTIY